LGVAAGLAALIASLCACSARREGGDGSDDAAVVDAAVPKADAPYASDQGSDMAARDAGPPDRQISDAALDRTLVADAPNGLEAGASGRDVQEDVHEDAQEDVQEEESRPDSSCLWGLHEISRPGAGADAPHDGTVLMSATGLEAIGDLNNDGRPDLVVTVTAYLDGGVNQFASSGSVSVLLGKGDGTFAAPVLYAIDTGAPGSVAVADLNGDGKFDLAVASQDTANPPAGYLNVLLGNGDGTFQPQMPYPTGQGAGSISIGDLNGDKRADVLTTSAYSDQLSVFLGVGDGTFQAPVTYATGSLALSSALVDLNGDGKLDLAVASAFSNSVGVLLGKGDGTFATQVTFPVGAYPLSVKAGDLNGDGQPDLVVANFGGSADSNTVGVLLGSGDGGLQPQVTYAVGWSPESVVIGDLNGDGHQDLAVVAQNDHLSNGIDPGVAGSLSVLLGRGDGTFESQLQYTVGIDPDSLAIGDFNGDGRLDLAAVNAFTNDVSVLVGACGSPGTVFAIDSTNRLLSFDAVGRSLSSVVLPSSVGTGGGGGIAFAGGNLYVTIAEPTHQVASYGPELFPHMLPPFSFGGLAAPFGFAYDDGNGQFYVTSRSSIPGVYDAVGTALLPSAGFPGLFWATGVAYDPDDAALWVTTYGGLYPPSQSTVGLAEYSETGVALHTFDLTTQFVPPAPHEQPYSVAVCPRATTGGSTVVVVGFADDGTGLGTGAVQGYRVDGTTFGSPFAEALAQPNAVSCNGQGEVYIADQTGLFRGDLNGRNLGLPGPFAGLAPPLYGVYAGN
jgi:hypothetical protein